MIRRAPAAEDRAVLQVWVVPEGSPPQRLDRAVLQGLDRFPTRASARKACDRGEIVVGGVVSESSRWVVPGDEIGWLEPVGRTVRPLPRRIEVLFEDDQLAVVVKPPGLPTTGTYGRTFERTLPVNLAPSGAPDALDAPRPVHRLDAATGGVLIAAKTRSAHAALGRAFEERRVYKRYRALVLGQLEGEGICEDEVDGRPATSRYIALGITPALRTGSITTVDLVPESGRTHQLRRHLAALGHPILGDPLYGPPGATLRGKGLFLFALEIGFDHPADGRPLRVVAPEPPKFESFRAREARRFARWHARTP